jgi:hypothetical protein
LITTGVGIGEARPYSGSAYGIGLQAIESLVGYIGGKISLAREGLWVACGQVSVRRYRSNVRLRRLTPDRRGLHHCEPTALIGILASW